MCLLTQRLSVLIFFVCFSILFFLAKVGIFFRKAKPYTHPFHFAATTLFSFCYHSPCWSCRFHLFFAISATTHPVLADFYLMMIFRKLTIQVRSFLLSFFRRFSNHTPWSCCFHLFFAISATTHPVLGNQGNGIRRLRVRLQLVVATKDLIHFIYRLTFVTSNLRVTCLLVLIYF
ncbi:hypothetical protein HanPI659440_Chr08g0308591 [Helianthus annuus]|nr:hypothetical protein HanPI659440_Chr08g0308591 [Helianthus annuus]